jgi:hypothetical protein
MFVSLLFHMAVTNKIKINTLQGRLRAAVLHSPLLVIWAFFFMGGIFPTEVEANGFKETALYEELSKQPTDYVYELSEDDPLHLYGLEPTLEESFQPAEEEIEESSDDDWKAIFIASLLCNLFLETDQAKQLTLPAHRGSATPLFILYHSWKSFLL